MLLCYFVILYKYNHKYKKVHDTLQKKKCYKKCNKNLNATKINL